GHHADCNWNQIPDSCDIAAGASRDVNGNGVPDECEQLGDLNCDGTVNALDIAPFLLALFDPAQYPIQYPNCLINNADINGDGLVNAEDIEGFILLLFGP
ncbi:MAG: hypothetical protein IH986_18875, partial [Planctomycetes bacterium]|nr:hypothetical protein [Planctomycetota bacterium]